MIFTFEIPLLFVIASFVLQSRPSRPLYCSSLQKISLLFCLFIKNPHQNNGLVVSWNWFGQTKISRKIFWRNNHAMQLFQVLSCVLKKIYILHTVKEFTWKKNKAAYKNVKKKSNIQWNSVEIWNGRKKSFKFYWDKLKATRGCRTVAKLTTHCTKTLVQECRPCVSKLILVDTLLVLISLLL